MKGMLRTERLKEVVRQHGCDLSPDSLPTPVIPMGCEVIGPRLYGQDQDHDLPQRFFADCPFPVSPPAQTAERGHAPPTMTLVPAVLVAKMAVDAGNPSPSTIMFLPNGPSFPARRTLSAVPEPSAARGHGFGLTPPP